jgi:multiple sugar transport system substrate-binding protein
MKTRLMFIIPFSFLLAGMLLLTSCAPTATPGEEPTAAIIKETVIVPQEVEVEKVVTATPEPAVISFWHAYNPLETEMLEKTIIPAFQEAHPDITVVSMNVPYDQFRRKLLTSIAGGTAPDLIRADIIWVPEFAYMGALASLDELMPDFNEYKDAVFPGPLATNYLKGHYYGLPLDTNTRVLIYNMGMFEEAGIAEPPGTMEDFLAACEKIKALGADKYCFADGGTYAWAVNPWIWSFGGDVTDPDITVATGYLNGPETKTAYEFLKGLVDKGYMHPGILGGGVDTWGGFGNNEIAMILEGPWFPPSFNMDTEYGFALMPAGPGGHISVVGGEDIVMFQQSKYKEAAAEFMRFMLSEEIQLKMAEVGQMPVLKSSLESDYIKNHEFFGYFLEQLKTAKARTPHPNWNKIEETYTLAGGIYLRGEKSFEEAFDEAATTIDALLPLPE